ncbi:hypothetical protein [Curtobacterium luteum]|uniref:Uncharacterized protein n=1 Tax=Curtobacterium luteum TaxID=33881 RepID=A0A175RHK7_9MICO|nr:hypothetical protein [Curtobacterium luteum]KTR02394.1 hypothetical protein NS184_16175 [Curtobacterium luteum]
MRWWIRVHRVPLLLGAVLVSSLVSIGLGPVALIFPSLAGGAPFGTIPVTAIAPLAVSIMLSSCVHRPGVPAVRQVEVLEVGLAVLMIVLTAGTAVAATALGADQSSAAALFRNSITFVGTTLVARPLIGSRHQAIPGVVWLLLTAVFGRTGDGVAVWASVVTTNTAPEYWLVSAVCLALGSIAAAHRIASRR